MRPSSSLVVLCLATLLLGAAGCDKSERLPATTAAKAAVAPADLAGDADRALALAIPNGSATVDSAIVALEESVKKNPEKTDSWILLGRAWIKKARESADPGFYAHADACARIALHLAPDSRLALDLRAMVLLNDHKFEEARQVTESITASRPDDPLAYGTLSDALLELGRFDEAVSAVQTMVDLKPNLPSYSRAAYLRWLQGDIGAAKEINRHAIDAGGGSRDPEPLAWVLVQAATMFWNEGDYEGADAGFDRALALFAEFAPALVGKGRVAMAEGQPGRAALWFERAYKVSPLAETAWLLGDARGASGDAAGSERAYALVTKEGKQTDGRTLALFLATKDRDPATALRFAERELGVRHDPYTVDTYAWALYRNGRFAEAAKAIAAATSLGTRDARLWYHAGAIRIAAGDAAGGRKLVERALALNPHFDASGAAEASALLAR